MAARRSVVLIAFDGVQPIDVTGPYEVFAGARAASGADPSSDVRYTISIAAPSAGIVRGESGLGLVADVALADLARRPVDTLIVCGGSGVHRFRADARSMAAVASVARRARRVCSVCTGTFVLAQAGFLDGRRATTHWARASRLQDEFPSVRVEPDLVFVRDGNVWSSAGVTAGIDLALALVEDDHGPAIPRTIARWLVMFLRRPGGQRQFSAPLWSVPVERDPIREVCEYVHREPSADLTVSALAARAHLSERHFVRVFTAVVGEPPGRYVLSARLDAARRVLETSTAGVEHVARLSGFGTAETMRRAFAKSLGVAPSEYRNRFRSTERTAG